MLFDHSKLRKDFSESHNLLSKTPVLVIDCQATGRIPDAGFILELGWTVVEACGASSDPDVESYLIKKPGGKKLPFRIQKITGLRENDLSAGHSLDIAWNRLFQRADLVSRDSPEHSCPTVAHYARYEEAVLRGIHGKGKNLPFDFICTHLITKKLLPELPRKSLRAVAGYFGYSLHRERRSADHVRATVHVWRHLVDLLDAREGIRTLTELSGWLNHRPASESGARQYPMDPKLRLGLPETPGVYRFYRSNGDPLYAGKANCLKRRVNSYFQKRKSHPELHLEMLTQARYLDVTKTETSLEAAVLESDEIKRLSPPYNLALLARDRKPVFCTADLESVVESPGAPGLLGPFPSKDLLQPALILNRAKKDEPRFTLDRTAIGDLLGIPAEYAPGSAAVKRGLRAFFNKHGMILDAEPFQRSLFRLGTALWIERRNRLDKETGREADENADDREDGSIRSWNPERVIRVLEGQILRIAQLLRRAKWLCLLCESTLGWTKAGGREDMRRVLVMKRGRIFREMDLPGSRSLPTPPGYRRSFPDRQSCIDLEAYDRLRIITTEIRRIIADGRNFEIGLAPRKRLLRSGIEKALRWL